MLRDHPTGNYRFLPGISAFSSGVIAMPGHEIVHATLGAPVPWRDGFALVERHLRAQGRTRTALCGVELRSPAPFTFDGFAKFNEGYRALLGEWDILVGDDNPIPRTNVAPVIAAPGEPSLYAFAYTIGGTTPAPTFVVAGAGEMRDRAQGADGIVRRGDTSPDGMREKARFVMNVMQERMRALGADWRRATAIDVYTAQPIHDYLDDILRPAGPAAIHGVRWFPSRPPIQGLEFEVDLRGVARELVL
ncbi:MAG: RidA family protein [Candidatus Rokuibacteriota bacterium]|nr:MAG: RidA family protein [Candidatus Rokubacteria bacterium]